MMKRTVILFFVFLITGTLFRCSEPKQNENNVAKAEKDSCCMKNDTASSLASLQSKITCPECGYSKMETMPTDICLIKYTCEKCKAELHPKNGDCCVFCSYGTHKCPSKEE